MNPAHEIEVLARPKAMPSRSRRSFPRRCLSALGPGLIAGAADDDPAGIATYSAAGALLGTGQLWTAFLTWPLMAAVQMTCARIGMATGRGGGRLPAKVYRRLLRIDELPQFITSIVKIDNITANRFSCTSIINGQKIISEVTIMMRVPDRRIAWQAVSDQFRLGVIFLDPLFGGTTKLTVKIRSIMEPLRLTGALREYLRNFKDFVERDST